MIHGTLTLTTRPTQTTKVESEASGSRFEGRWSVTLSDAAQECLWRYEGTTKSEGGARLAARRHHRKAIKTALALYPGESLL